MSGNKGAVLGSHRTLFFGPDSDPKDIVAVVRETALGEEDIDKMAESIEVPQHAGGSASSDRWDIR